MLDPVAGELVGVGCREDLVAGDLGGDDLGDDLWRCVRLWSDIRFGNGTYVTVGEPHDESVFWRIVLVLCLGDQPLTGVVIGLSLTTTTVFRLVA